MNEPDPLDEQWCCLTCYWKGRSGELMAKDALRCPRCDSNNIHPADIKRRPPPPHLLLEAEQDRPVEAASRARTVPLKRRKVAS